MMSTSKSKKKEIMVNYSNKNVGFSILIPDNWMEVKKSSYSELGINDNTLFIFVVDKFTTLSAVFGGYCSNDSFNDVFTQFTNDKFKVLYKNIEELENIIVRQIVIERNNKKILNSFCLINGMLINFTINLSNKLKTNTKKEITGDTSFKTIKELLKTLRISVPLNPPVYIENDHEIEVPVYTSKAASVEIKTEKNQKKTAQLMVEKECKYRNSLIPDFYFKYNNHKNQMSIMNDEIYSNIYGVAKKDEKLSTAIKKALTNEFETLKKYDINYDKNVSKNNLVIKLEDEYILININDNNEAIVNELVNSINELIEKESFDDEDTSLKDETPKIDEKPIPEEKVLVVPVINEEQSIMDNNTISDEISESEENVKEEIDDSSSEEETEENNEEEETVENYSPQYDLEDFQEYFHNIDGHASFRFLFPANSGDLVIRDFNVFDIVSDDILEYRVFIFKCDNEEKYQEKLNDWMSKNISSSGADVIDEYVSKSSNGLDIKTFILSNNKFYRVTYVFGYLIAVSSYNDPNQLIYAEIALDNVKVGEDSKEFIEAYNRKINSINILKAQGIPYIEELPVIQSSYEVTGKSLDDIAKRAIVLCICCNYSNDIVSNKKKKYLKDSKKFFTKLLEKYNVNDVMTKEEKELFEKGNKNLAVQISWQFEGLAILLWTLGLIDDISFPDTLVDTDSLTAIVSSCDSYNDFVSKCQLRNLYDVLDLADLTYRYNWYCVDAHINSETPIINPEIVMERHRAFKWLLTDEKWDKVEINT